MGCACGPGGHSWGLAGRRKVVSRRFLRATCGLIRIGFSSEVFGNFLRECHLK